MAVSDAEFEEVKRQLQQLQTRVGQWGLNGLEAFDTGNQLEFGASSARLSPMGMQARVTSSTASPPAVSNTNAGVVFVKDFANGNTPGHPWAALFGSYDSSTSTMGATLSSKADGNDNSEDYIRVLNDADTDANSFVELGHFGAALAGYQTLRLSLNGVALSSAYLRLHNDTADDNIAGVTNADGMLFYRSDLDVFRGRANGAWVSLASTDYVDTAVAGVPTAMKVTGAGYQTLPSAAVAATITSAAGAYTNGSYTQLTASSGQDWYIVGANTRSTAGVEFEIDIATGGAGSEAVKSTIYAVGSATAPNRWEANWFPYPIAVASGTRIAARCRDSTGSSSVLLSLIYVQQANLVAL